MGATCSIAEAKIEYCFQTIPQLMTELRNLRTVVATLPQTSAVVADVNKIVADVKVEEQQYGIKKFKENNKV